MFRIVLGRLEQAWIGVSLKNFWRLSHLYRLYLILKSTWLPWQIFIPASLNLTSLSTSFGIEVPSILFVGIGRCIFKKFFFMTKCFQNRIDKWFNIACLKSLVDFQACICTADSMVLTTSLIIHSGPIFLLILLHVMKQDHLSNSRFPHWKINFLIYFLPIWH